MARSRYIKPALFANEDLADCSPHARILFIGLWTIADREGILEYRPKRIKAAIFPYEDVNVSDLLAELEARKFIIRYEVDGSQLLFITNFTKHQRPHHTEADSVFPKPTPEQIASLTVTTPLPNRDAPPVFLSTLVPSSENGEWRMENGVLAQSDDCGAGLPEPEKFQALVDGWNALPEGIAPRCSKPNSGYLAKGWRRVMRSADVRDHFKDTNKLIAEIRNSSYLHGKQWFRLAWIMATGDNGEWNVIKVLEGAYRDRGNKPSLFEENILAAQKCLEATKYGPQ